MRVVVAVLAVLVGSVVCAPGNGRVRTPGRSLDRRFDDEFHSSSRRQSSIVITGPTTGPVQSRLEIRSLQAKPEQWNIYLLAMARFMAADQSDPLSYYQIAGIHGRPPVSWNGVSGVASPEYPGYCTHSSNIFTTWHRPYLALFEQILVKHAIDIAGEFPAGTIRARYLAAAQTLRLPYWDWAATPSSGSNVLPDALTTEMISVVTPTSPHRRSSIANPLFSYKFHSNTGGSDPNGFFYFPWTQMNQTIRAPSASNDPNATSRNSVVAANFNAARDSLRSRLYTLLTQYDRFDQFANSAATTGTRADSVEALHDNVHGMVGFGQGHMSVLDFSAFDPIFWLHHAMVDRLSALWQVVHPSSYVESAAQTGGNYWYNRGDVLDVNSGLSPFTSPAGGFWSSADVRTTEVFNYDYPGISKSTGQSAGRSLINQLYGTSSISARLIHDISVDAQSTNHSSPTVESAPPAASSSPSSSSNSSAAIDYMAVITAPKDGWKSSYFVYLFLGPAPSDTADWMSSSNLVGIQSIVTTQRDPAKITAQSTSMYVSSTIPLNDKLALVASDQVPSGVSGKGLFGPDNVDLVTQYLEQKLDWTIIDSTGTVVSPDAIPGFEVAVVSQAVVPAVSKDSFPEWVGSGRYLGSVTRNKLAGWKGSSSSASSPAASGSTRSVKAVIASGRRIALAV